jgi:hypothetical protein
VRLARRVQRQKGVEDLVENARWQKAKVITILVGNLPEIVPGPQELVALGNDHSGALIVESKVTLDGRRDLDGGARPGWRATRDQQRGNDL